MKTILALACIALGLFGWIGQLVSSLHFRLAQKLGLQEKDEDTDPAYRDTERGAARWDVLVLWTFVAAGVLMLLDHPAWPVVGLVAGGIHLDTAGRETAKRICLRRAGICTGSPADDRRAVILFAVMALLAIALIASSVQALGFAR